MYYILKDNQLLIFYKDGTLKENATENNNECEYCERKNCIREETKNGGCYCDWMKCIYKEG